MKTTGLIPTVFLLLSAVAAAQPGDSVPLRLLVVETQRQAAEIRARAEAGSFDALIREASVDPSAASGGYLGAFALSDLRAEFRDAAGGLGPGEISPVFALDGRFALIQVVPEHDRNWIEVREGGLELARARRFNEAAERFAEALDLAAAFDSFDLRRAESLNDLAEIRRIQGDPQAAVALYRQAVPIWETVLGAEHPDLATPLNNLAEAYRLVGEPARAVPLYRRSIATWEDQLGGNHPNVATGVNNLGLALHAQGESAEAEALFRRALEIWERTEGPWSRNVASVLHNLATVLAAVGSEGDAESPARRSLDIMERSLGPDHRELIPGLENLSRIALETRDYADAILLSERALAIRWHQSDDQNEVRGLVDALTDLIGLGLASDARIDAAFDALMPQLGGAQVTAESLVAMGGLLLSAGLDEQGRALLMYAAERFPQSLAVDERLGGYYAESGRNADALDTFERALDRDPPNDARYRLLTRMGDIHRETDALERSLDAYRAAEGLGISDPAAAIGTGLAWAQQGRPDLALNAFDRAAAVSPESAEARYRQAESHLGMGRLDLATEAARQAIALDPMHRRARYILGQALIRSGLNDQGRLELEEYRQLESEDRDRQNASLRSVQIQTEAAATLAEGDTDAALGLFETGAETFPDRARFRLTLGLLQIRVGRDREAVQTLESLVEAGIADDSLIHRSLAGAYARIGNSARSQRHTALYLQKIGPELEAQVRR